MQLDRAKTPIRLSLVLSSALVLSACDFGLSDLGDAIDRPPEPGAFDASGSSSRPEEDNLGVIRYPNYEVAVAQRPETVADMASRIGIDANQLAAYNGLEPSTPLRRGEVISIPPGALDGTSDFEADTRSVLDDVPETPSVVTDEPEPVRHTVKQGESAFSIARQYNVSVTSLASWNGLDRDMNLRVGQRLLIPTSQIPASNDVANDPTPEPPSAEDPLPKPQPAAKPVDDPTKLSKPVAGNIIRPFDGQGIDYGAAVGTTVTAAADGTVANVLSTQDGAKIILMRHPDNLYTVYSNVTNVALRKGNKIKRGDTLGIVAGGNPPFLHFEVRKGTEAVDPAGYLK